MRPNAERITCLAAWALDIWLLAATAALGAAVVGLLTAWHGRFSVEGSVSVLAAAFASRLLVPEGRGLLAFLAERGWPVVGRACAFVNRLESRLRSFLGRNRRNLLGFAVATLFALAAAELALRVLLPSLPVRLANYLATPYTDKLFGIYRWNAELGTHVMRPDYERKAFFNGYRWQHRTDRLGFRNPTELTRADVVLLGDSMVYGHGVDEPDTLRHRLEAVLQRPVANLGMQDSSMHQAYQFLKHFGLELEPRLVLAFFLPHNDIVDLTNHLSPAERRRLLDLPLDDHATPYVEQVPRRRTRLQRLKFYLGELYVLKAYGFVRESARQRLTGATVAGERSEAARVDAGPALVGDWRAAPPFDGDAAMLEAMLVHLRLLEKAHQLATLNGVRFVCVLINGQSAAYEHTYETILETFCSEKGIECFDLGPVIERALAAGQPVFLEGDGHFTGRGAQLVAEALAAEFPMEGPRPVDPETAGGSPEAPSR